LTAVEIDSGLRGQACAPTVACSLVQVEEMASSGLSAEDFESLCLVFTFTGFE